MTINFDFSVNQLRSVAALINFADANDLDLDDIQEIGYNERSGNVYIAFEDGLNIYLFEGRTDTNQINYMRYDNIIGEEIEYDNIEDAMDDIRTCDI
jgi:hypothetical protein